MHLLSPALEPQMWEKKSLDPPMAPTPMIIFSSGNVADVDQQLTLDTWQGEQPDFCSNKIFRRLMLLNKVKQVMYLWTPESL